MNEIIALVQAAVAFGTVILFGATGEILTEKSGNLNLGVPGIMYLGGICGLMGAFFYESAVAEPNKIICFIIAFIFAFAASVLGGLIYSVLTITLRANQNVTGLTLTIFGAGFGNFFGGMLNKMSGGVGQLRVAVTSEAFRTEIPFLSDLGIVGELIFSYGVLAYLAIIVALLVNWYLNKTSVGLNLRAVGENPATADAAGINVTKYKYFATCLGAGISGLGGLYYVMDYTSGTWSSDGGIERLGWLAVALVIFAVWRSNRVILGAYLFGILSWMYFYIPGLTRSSQEIFKMLPYLVTVAVLIFISLRKKRENEPPASLGNAYFREDR